MAATPLDTRYYRTHALMSATKDGMWLPKWQGNSKQSHTQLISQRTMYYLLEKSAEKATKIFHCKYMLVATSGQSRDSTSAAIETH